MPGLVHSGNHHPTCTKNDQTSSPLVQRGLQTGARMLSTGGSTVFGGKCKKLKASIHKALRRILKFFYLTLIGLLCTKGQTTRPGGQVDDGAKPLTTAFIRVFPEFSHRLIHRLVRAFSSGFRRQ